MARISNTGFLSGTTGKLVFYEVNGKQYLRTKPRKRPKKRGHQPSFRQRVFGIVSQYGSGMLRYMKPAFSFSFGLGSYNRARGWMWELYHQYGEADSWPCSVQDSGSCQLNEAADLRAMLKAGFGIRDEGNGRFVFKMDAFQPKRQLKAAPDTTTVRLKFALSVSGCTDRRRFVYSDHRSVEFAYNNDLLDLPEMLLETGAQQGDLLIAAVGLEYITSSNPSSEVKEAKWLPAALVLMARAQ